MLTFRLGPSIHVPNLSILGWTSIPQLLQIIASDPIYNGEYHTSRYLSQGQFFELIPFVHWVTSTKAGHMWHLGWIDLGKGSSESTDASSHTGRDRKLRRGLKKAGSTQLVPIAPLSTSVSQAEAWFVITSHDLKPTAMVAFTLSPSTRQSLENSGLAGAN